MEDKKERKEKRRYTISIKEFRETVISVMILFFCPIGGPQTHFSNDKMASDSVMKVSWKCHWRSFCSQSAPQWGPK